MKEFKGTAAPWRIADDDVTFCRLATDTYHQLKAGGGYHDDDLNNGFCIQGYMSTHDANLISAAPELLGALQEIIGSGFYLSGDLHDMAESAIKKALGEQK